MSSNMRDEREILAFCHIIKCSGTTLSSILRRNLGFKQLSALPKPGNSIYGEKEFTRDLSIFPFTNSITGHGLRPYIHYGKRDCDLAWYSWFRDPLARLVSGYQHSIEKGRRSVSFEDWLKEPNHRNLQVYFMTGSEDDLAGAKEIVLSRMKFVGLVERFDESLLLFKDRLGLTDFNLDYVRPNNTAKSSQSKLEIFELTEKYSDLVEQNISVDQELYDWFLSAVYPGYIHDYGEARLEQDFQRTFRRAPVPVREKLREASNNLMRRAIYSPLVRRL